MKSDIALHEIMRIDEYDEEHPEANSVDKRTPKAAQSDEVSSAGVATQEPTGSEIDRAESPISVDIPTDTVINYDEPPTTELEDPAAVEMLINNDETATESIDTAVAEALMSPDETTSDAAITPVEEDTTEYDEPPTELIDAPVDETVMSNDVTASELAEISAVEDEIDLDEISTESVALPTETAIDYEAATPDLADLPPAKTTMYDGETSIEDPLPKRLEAIPANTARFFAEVGSTISAFFNNNRQLLTNLGVIFVAFMVTKLAFAGLNAIDDLPLVSPLLKLVGLYYVLQFIWNYLIRQQDRQKLAEKINTTKAEVLGDRD